MVEASLMHRHRTAGALPAVLSVLALLLLTAGAAPAQRRLHSAQRLRATCSLEINGNGGAFAAVLEHSSDPDLVDGFRVATQAQAPPGVRSISLRCNSSQGPIPVGVNPKLITHQHLKGFSGVDVVDGTDDVAKACGILPWFDPGQEPRLLPLLSFCGDFHVDFDEFRIQSVQLMHQPSERHSYLVVFGGGINGSSVSAVIHQAQIINSAADSAVVVAGSSRVNISRLHCSGNMGMSGACIAAWSAAAVQLQHSSIANCSASVGGAVAAFDDSTMAIHNSSFVGCRGVIGGGAVDVDNNASLTVNDSQFVSNRALNEDAFGGALAVVGSATASLFNSSFVNNSADAGGAIACSCYVRHSCQLQVVDGTFTRNTAGMFGGAINALNAVVHVGNTIFDRCSAGVGGGAVAAPYAAAVSVTRSTFTVCNASKGGAIDVQGDTSLNMSDSSFLSNAAWSEDPKTGGGGGALAVVDNATASLLRVYFIENSAIGGGAVWAQGNTLTVNDSQFVSNRALNEDAFGGALAVVGSATASLFGSSFVNNSADLGGAIACWCDQPHSCSVRLAASVVQGNNATAISNKTAVYGGCGGGVAAWYATVAIADSQLLQNTAWSSGGGVYLKDSTLTLNQTKVAFNNAANVDINYQGFGGGMYCRNSHVTVDGCNISFNTGWTAGGGFQVTDSHVTVLDSIMLNNTGRGVGGLMCVYGTGAAPLEVVFDGNTTIQNSSAVSGGAFFFDLNSTAAAESATNRSRIIVNGSVLLQNNSASLGQDVIVKGRPFLHVNGKYLRMSNSSVLRQDLCVVGDSRSADGFCGLCPAQMFSLDPKQQQPCRPCPDHATCVGGAVVVADSGFFNTGDLGGSCNMTNDGVRDTIIRCPNPLACRHNASAVALHKLHPYFTFMTAINLSAPVDANNWTAYTSGLCETGYTGLLCGNCQPNFGQTDAFSCSACLGVNSTTGKGDINTGGIGALLAAYALVFIVIVWATIAMNMLEHNSRASGSFRGDTAFRVGFFRQARTTREVSASDDDELQLTDVLKALIMYAQYFAGIIAKLPVKWPGVLAVPLEQLSDSWSRAMGASASLDCVLKSLPDGIDPAGLKALINLLMPLAMFLFLLLCQTVWWACKRQCVWLLATFGLRVFKLLWPDGSPAGSSASVHMHGKFKSWCIQRQFYASRSSGWLRGVSGLREFLRHRWVVTLLVTVFFFYPSVVRVAVGMFTCIRVCDKRYWVMNVDKACPRDDLTSVQGRWALGVGIPAMLVLVAVPISVAWLLWVSAHKGWLDKPSFQQRFGFMFSDYKSEVADKRSRLGGTPGMESNGTGWRWSQLLVMAKRRVILAWDAVIHMQTIVLVFMSVFGLVMHEFYQTLILAAVFGSCLLLVVWLQPFRGRYTQRLQAQSNAVLFATCFLVLTFIPPDGMDKRQHEGYEAAARVTGGLLLALNILFVAYGLALMLQRLSRMLNVLVGKQRRSANTAGP